MWHRKWWELPVPTKPRIKVHLYTHNGSLHRREKDLGKYWLVLFSTDSANKDASVFLLVCQQNNSDGSGKGEHCLHFMAQKMCLLSEDGEEGKAMTRPLS